VISRFVSCLLVPVALALCVAAGAVGAVRFGVTEDAGKYADGGGATFFPTLTHLGMTQNRIAYVYAVRLAASMNPSRTALLVGTPFRVG
jgi:hypothetical protein